MADSFETPLSSEQILSHPRFAEARATYIEEMLRLHENQVLLNQVLFDEGRAYVFFTVITMHAGYRPEDRQTWPTFQLLKQKMEEQGIASGRRVHAILRRLSDIGYVESLPAPGDRRVKLLAPTQTMLAHDQRSLIVYYHPLHVLFPEPGYPEPMHGDREFQKRARQIGFAFISHSQQFIRANPTIAFFLPRQAGMMILTKLMQLSLDQDGTGDPDISFHEIGDSFGISRTHVRRLLLEADAQGLVRLRGKRATLSSECRAGFDRFLADTMAGNDFIYRLARQQLAMSELDADGQGGVEGLADRNAVG